MLKIPQFLLSNSMATIEYILLTFLPLLLQLLMYAYDT